MYSSASRGDRGASAACDGDRRGAEGREVRRASRHDDRVDQSHLATERALELFAPVQQADYVGWNGGAVGPKGHDDSVLAGYEIVDDPLGAKNAVPSADEDGAVCLHTEIEPYDDEPSRGACANCGEDFGIRVARSADGEYDDMAEEEPIVDAGGLADAVAAA